MSFISSNEVKKCIFYSPLMKYTFFTSVDEIKVTFTPKI